MEKMKFPTREKKDDFAHMPGFSKFMRGRQKDVNKVNLLKKNKKIDPSKTHFTVQNLIFSKKAIRKLKGEGAYKIKSESVDRGEIKFRSKYTATQSEY